MKLSIPKPVLLILIAFLALLLTLAIASLGYLSILLPITALKAYGLIPPLFAITTLILPKIPFAIYLSLHTSTPFTTILHPSDQTISEFRASIPGAEFLFFPSEIILFVAHNLVLYAAGLFSGKGFWAMWAMDLRGLGMIIGALGLLDGWALLVMAGEELVGLGTRVWRMEGKERVDLGCEVVREWWTGFVKRLGENEGSGDKEVGEKYMEMV